MTQSKIYYKLLVIVYQIINFDLLLRNNNIEGNNIDEIMFSIVKLKDYPIINIHCDYNNDNYIEIISGLAGIECKINEMKKLESPRRLLSD